VLLEEFGDDFVFLLDFGMKFFGFAFGDGFLLTVVGSVRLSLEAGGAIFKQLLLPLVETDRTDTVFVAEVRHRHLFEKVLADNRYFLCGC